MNIQVCNLPNGEDPDSFVSEKQLEDIQDFFNSNSKDFIVYKASLLLSDSDNDPVKKASVIRDIVESISKVSDFIKESYTLRSAQK